MPEAAQIVCSNCQAVNRLPTHRLSQSPICGRCKTPLSPGHPLELTDDNFHKFVRQTSLPVLVDFWAVWCGPCKMMAPAFAEAAAELAPNMMLVKVNTDAANQVASQYHIQSIPTLVLFRGGQELARQAGAMHAQQIVQWARNCLR